MDLFKRVFWRSTILIFASTCSILLWNVLLRTIDQRIQQPCNYVAYELYEEITFPKIIGSTGLVMERLSSYEGPFLEDKSNEEVSDVACLIIRNQGPRVVSCAKINLHCNDKSYYFELWDIPNGESVVVLDRNRTKYHQTVIISASASIMYADAPLNNAEVIISEQGMGQVVISNISNCAMDNLVLCHKGYDSSCSLYLGGITHYKKCPKIESGETIVITPEHYANGYSRILWIRSELDPAATA